HAVQIKPVETNRFLLAGLEPLIAPIGWALTSPASLIVSTEPVNEGQNLGIAPHPCGKTLKIRQGRVRFRIIRYPRYKAIDPVSIRPVGLNRNCVETLFHDKVLRNLSANSVKFCRTMGGFADQDEVFSFFMPAYRLYQEIVIHSGS